MTNRLPEPPEGVRKFAPKPRPESGNPTDDAGSALIIRLQQAAKVSNENCDRAMALAHKLSGQLRAAEDRAARIDAEIAEVEARAARSADARIREMEGQLGRAKAAADERAAQVEYAADAAHRRDEGRVRACRGASGCRR